MEYQFRPVDEWPGKRTRRPASSRFKASFSQTIDLLESELRKIDAKQIVIQAYLKEKDIRMDGMIRAGSHPTSPGIILSFRSKHGQLVYPCDKFNHWHANLRAIALSLTALRNVDRYGVTRQSEQYRGWAKIEGACEAGHHRQPKLTIKAAVNLISVLSMLPPSDILEDSTIAAKAIRVASKKMHPDLGGSKAEFQKLQKHIELLKSYHRLNG